MVCRQCLNVYFPLYVCIRCLNDFCFKCFKGEREYIQYNYCSKCYNKYQVRSIK